MRKNLIEAGYGMGAFGIVMLMTWWFKEPEDLYKAEREQLAIEREELQLAKAEFEKLKLIPKTTSDSGGYYYSSPVITQRFVNVHPTIQPLWPTHDVLVNQKVKVIFVNGKFIRSIK